LQINYFLTLSETLSFTKTAKKLYVSQPAVSKQIAALERELDILLFKRNSNGIELTPAGKLFYDYFKSASDTFKHTLTAAKQLMEDQPTTLKIGYQEGWNIAHLVPIIKSYNDSLKLACSLQFISCKINEMRGMLLEGEIDVVLAISNSFKTGSAIQGENIASIVNLLFYGVHHPLANNPQLSIHDFENETFIVFESHSIDTRQLVSDFCAPFGFKPTIRTVPNVESMIFEVETGNGVAIFDEWIRFKHNPTLNYIEVGGKHDVSAFKLSDSQNEPLQALIDYLKSHLIH
jgi:DNA-binding transcriptional LysR family regulator